jgi:hypothetical protein
MSFDTSARRQAKVAFDALADRLVKDLSTVAQDEAEAAAARAREQAERAAEAALGAVRSEGEARLAAAQAKHDELLKRVDSAREEVSALEKRVTHGQDERKQLAQARDEALKKLDIETRRANEVASHLDAQTRRASELASQLDGEARRAAELTAQLDAASRRAGELTAQADAETRRATELAAQLEGEAGRTTELTSRLDVETRRAADLTSQFENETRRASALASQLDGERRRTSDLSSQLEGETRRVKEVTDQLDAETRRGRELSAATEELRQRLDALVDRVGGAVAAIDRATSPSEILETLLEPLAKDFAVAAVFLVSPSSLNGWREIGLGPESDVTKLIVARDTDSLLTRAAAERKRLFAASTARKPLTGLLGKPVARAAALPVLAGEHVVAVVYGEDVEPSALPSAGAGTRITEMLIDHANLRLTVKRSPSLPSGTPRYSTPRQAPRIKSREGVDVTVDGAESALVDVSTSGAQILSPVAMKPNRTLRMLLRAGEQAIACRARVIWARFEQPRGAAAARYRVGVKFTDVEPRDIDDFIQQGLVLVTQ